MPKKSTSVYETVDAWEAVWGDGVVPTWLGGMTVGFVLLFPLLKMMFPKTIKKHGAFLLAFEIVAFFPLSYCAYEGAEEDRGGEDQSAGVGTHQGVRAQILVAVEDSQAIH